MPPEETLPRDLPGRFGRVISAVETLLSAAHTPAVVAGGWAVWRHGFAGRVTMDLDIVVPQDSIAEIQRLASLFGFQALETKPGRWPKLFHKETNIDVDLMPEGGIPGIPGNQAPVAIRHPSHYGAQLDTLQFIDLAGLIELKLGAGRLKDQADIIELIKANPDQIQQLTSHLQQIHPAYPPLLQLAIHQAEREL